ncbi:MAG TPA: response regulator [Longimicrobiales bacterium]|nr:response regulator [Longimicrobiales bacterium]
MELTVLVADDNADNRAVYVMVLTHFGYRVLEAADGAEAIQVAHAEHPDLILMDLQMPRVTGFQATERLKKDPTTASIPVIAVTALAMEGDRNMAFAVGCDGYFAKPVEPRALAAEVRRRIGAPQNGAGPGAAPG